MAIDVSKELQAIEEAVYGEEVRGSIHDSIEKIAEEVNVSNPLVVRRAIAPLFSNDSTVVYNVGDYVYRLDPTDPEALSFYKCQTPTTGGTFDGSCWIKATLGEDFAKRVEVNQFRFDSATSPNILAGKSCDDLTTPALWFVNKVEGVSTLTDFPIDGPGFIRISGPNPNRLIQQAYPANFESSSYCLIRTRHGGTWGEWHKLSGGGSMSVTDTTLNIDPEGTAGEVATQLADEFSSSVSYAVGDLVTKDGILYKFTVTHPAGEWNSSHVASTSVETELRSMGDKVDDAVFDIQGIVDSTLSVSGKAADAKVTGDEITGLKEDFNQINETSMYKVSVTWEAGAINGSTGEESENANYSRTADYIPTSDADSVSIDGGTLILYNKEDNSYVRKESKYVRTADSPYAINKSYEYFRVSIGNKLADHPERHCLIYKNTKAQADIETVKYRMLGKYKSPMYFNDGKSASWVQTSSKTILELPHDAVLLFEGFSTEAITVNDILAVADAASFTTVSGDTIQGNNFAIIYNIATKAISINSASTYTYNNADEIVLFAVSWNSFVAGAIVDAVIRRSYERNITRLAQVEAAIDSDTHLPSYWLEYLGTKIAYIQAKDMDIGNHGDSFVFVTDLHYNTNDGNSAGAIDYILNHTSVSKVVIGGDICNGATASKADCVNQILACRDAFRKINPYYLRGNHDNNTEITNPTAEKAISDSELYGLTLKPIENEIIGNRELHYYFDNPVQKIRYICLDTGHPDTNVISDSQITWMQGLITELQSGWTVIVLTHQYYSNAETGERDGNGDKILAGLNMVYDSADVTIACVICGHSHRDYMETTAKGFPVICTTCDVRGGEGGGLVRTKNTYTEQAFDVFHIDTTARMIYATRIGAGSDRSTTY